METIKGEGELFKGGNYSRKYGIYLIRYYIIFFIPKSDVFKYFLGIQDRSEHVCDLGKLQETKYTFYQTRCNKLSNATQFAITYEMSSIFKFKTDVHKGLIHAG